MIINVPTGLYKSVLPKKESDATSITFLVSNTIPPRSNLLFPKIPIGLINGEKEVPIIDIVERRKDAGQLIFTVSTVAKTEEGYGLQRYEIGQVIEFSKSNPKSIEPMKVGYSTETRHNVSTIDYGVMEVTSTEEQAIDDLTLTAKDILMDKLNEYKRLRLNAEGIANDSQKLINETTKVIDALQLTLKTNGQVGSTTGEYVVIADLVAKLASKRNEAFKTRDIAIEDANRYAKLASTTLDSLRTVSVLVK